MAPNDRVERPRRRAFRFALLGTAAGFAGGVGILLPIYMTGGLDSSGMPRLVFLPLAFALGGFVGGFAIGFFREGVGDLVVWVTQGSRGRSRAEYSHIQSLVIRGAYREAVEACVRAAEAHPTDPRPLIMGGDVLRKHLNEYGSAVEWLRRAQKLPGLTTEEDMTIARELVELYEEKLRTPEKALPELARIRDSYPGTRAAQWAENTLRQLKASIWTDIKSGDDESIS